ncbi:expansin A24 [Actinidia rufa]|uniref:Expansin A24 n=1 Tax=Actinidia rufa TaxID=165716 RepID=A0A7J0H1G9_9ERIC|nr:expansin A24 [Actinidia rufa]
MGEVSTFDEVSTLGEVSSLDEVSTMSEMNILDEVSTMGVVSTMDALAEVSTMGRGEHHGARWDRDPLDLELGYCLPSYDLGYYLSPKVERSRLYRRSSYCDLKVIKIHHSEDRDLDARIDAINTNTNALVTMDALIRKTEPPFIERVIRTRVSSRFKLPTQLGVYDRKTDPMDHLDSYKNFMTLHGYSNESKANKYIATKESAKAKCRRQGMEDYKRKEPDSKQADYLDEAKTGQNEMSRGRLMNDDVHIRHLANPIRYCHLSTLPSPRSPDIGRNQGHHLNKPLDDEISYFNR